MYGTMTAATMRTLTTMVLLVLGSLALHARCELAEESGREEDDIGILGCVLENNIGSCLRTTLARDLDQIEEEVTGEKSEPPVSAVVEQAGNIIAEVVDDLQKSGGEGIAAEAEAESENIEEARKKKYGKKKKKHLHKFMGLAMMMKMKISLLLQLISTHFQLKFFIIAIISLLLNVTRFWLELKKSQPAKVIYYEQAHHQHHYDHEDEHGYWARSANETPQNFAYRAYAPTE